MLFELTTGRRPYSGPVFVVLAQILTSPVPPLREFRPDADPRLEAICQQAMAKDLAARPASMAAFAAQLSEYLDRINLVPVMMFAPAATPFGDLLEEPQVKEVLETQTQKAKVSRLPILVGAVVLGLILVIGTYLSLRTKRGDVGVAAPDKTIKEVETKGEKPTVSAPSPSAKAMDLPNRRGGEEVSFEIADGVKMVFCWIPKGKATLGSPESEKDRLDIETEHEFTTEGFWLAKTECPQKEWESVMGSNPSSFSASGDGKAKVQGMDTGNFPVEQVNWDDTVVFMKKLCARGGLAKAFGKSGDFQLPHEDQWEYAYRGGKGNKQAFYWGDVLNGDNANCEGNSPYGTDKKGPYLARTRAVGSYATLVAHPWGLSDMSGNVLEWCDNLASSDQPFKMIRGGACGDSPSGCRAANRRWFGPWFRNAGIGFRVCFFLGQ